MTVPPSFLANAESRTAEGIAHLLASLFTETHRATAEHLTIAGWAFEASDRAMRLARAPMVEREDGR